jgi:four helix bundle suffix protein
MTRLLAAREQGTMGKYQVMSEKGLSDGPDGADRSEGTGNRMRLRPSGGYRKLRSYQVATVIYDGTVSFCDRFIDRKSRTHDQMVQAARSGGKNIAEGSRAAATTSQTELRLVNVARASLEELLLDYEDYLRQRKLRAWVKDDAEALAVRAVGRELDRTDGTDRADPVAHYQVYARWLEHNDPGVVANALICLIHQTNYLLDQQISALERDFVKGGGYSEQLAAARIAERSKPTGQAARAKTRRTHLPAVRQTYDIAHGSAGSAGGHTVLGV